MGDIGTGAGLPGVPLAITEPDKPFVLLDSNGKKTRFLLEVKRALGLSNIEVETTESRIGDPLCTLTPSLQEPLPIWPPPSEELSTYCTITACCLP
ncbi:MAG: hypothetical protein CM15mP25_1450 [Gammaproteobacteria bacterium]|nr:MAG: hypothetical protein CM15mP25_1450 [Gammaproteobacteria bacterium]